MLCLRIVPAWSLFVAQMQPRFGGWDMFYAYPENAFLVLFFETDNGRRIIRGGQPMKWVKSMEALTSGLARVGAIRLTGWGPRLEAIGEMAEWRSYIGNLSSSL